MTTANSKSGVSLGKAVIIFKVSQFTVGTVRQLDGRSHSMATGHEPEADCATAVNGPT